MSQNKNDRFFCANSWEMSLNNTSFIFIFMTIWLKNLLSSGLRHPLPMSVLRMMLRL